MATLVFVFIVVGGPCRASGAPIDDVAGATRTWIEAMNSRDPDKVVALYDSDAVLWGTVSPSIRDTRQAIQEYFDFLRTAPAAYKIVLGSSGCVCMVIWASILAPTPFPASAMVSQ
jgi:hypothetical protein